MERFRAIRTDAIRTLAAGAGAPTAAAAPALPASPLRALPPGALNPSRAPPAYEALSLGFFSSVAPIYLVAVAILAGDALGVNLCAVPLWLAAMLAALSAVLFMRRAAPAAIAIGALLPAVIAHRVRC